MLVVLRFYLHALGKLRQVDGNYVGREFFKAFVHANQREADEKGSHKHADDQSDLLPLGRRAHKIAGLQVLRSRAGIGRRTRDDASNCNRERGECATPVHPATRNIAKQVAP